MSSTFRSRYPVAEAVTIPVARVQLVGDLVLPGGATGLVVFVHGSGSSRLSPRNAGRL
jgi:putative phosphoribosyl transferase